MYVYSIAIERMDHDGGTRLVYCSECWTAN